jgi:hypothetical protein
MLLWELSSFWGSVQVSLAAISHSSSGQLNNTLPITLTARLVIGMENHAFTTLRVPSLQQ